jgi:D-galactose 1-dehydrogenase
MERQKIRLALVGFGHISQFQLRALELVNLFELCAVCDLDPAKQATSPAGTPFFTSQAAMLDSVEVDAVLVSTPNHTHYQVARQALVAGRHVLLEKPATATLAELDELRQLARANNLLLTVAFHSSFGKEVLWFLEQHGAGLSAQLGPLTSFRSTFYDPYLSGGTLLPRATSLGGSWVDSGINALSVLARFIAAETFVLEDSAFTRLPTLGVSDIQANVCFRFSTDGHDRAGWGLIESNWTQGVSLKITRLFYGASKQTIVLHHTKEQVWQMDADGNSTLLADCSGAAPRPVNHYLGVFEDYARRLAPQTDNLDLAHTLHQLLFAAL